MISLALPLFATTSALIVSASTNSVPFLAQAPFGEWRDYRQAQGCEEAVALMAVAWARKRPLSKIEGRKQIIAISNWEKKTLGSYVDTSVEDTAQHIIRTYLKYPNINVQQNISTQQIVDALALGNLVITAVNGREVGIPYYLRPGPRHHTLLITGYVSSTDSFIVNDPGTKQGEALRVPRAHLQHALQDYPSGNGTSRRTLPPAMIVFRR